MYTYLIIDDESLIRKGTIKKLAPLSDRITCCGEAENGKEGLEMIEKLCPDLVILDMQMPLMDGMELLPYLCENYPDMSLIVISAYQNFDYARQALASNAADYILKPFGREEIQRAVLAVIDSFQSRQQTKNRVFTAQQEKETACYQLDLRILGNLLMGYETETPKITSMQLDFLNQPPELVLLTLYFHQKYPSADTVNEWLRDNRYDGHTVCLTHPYIPQFLFLLFSLPEHLRVRSEYTEQFIRSLTGSLKQQGFALCAGVSRGFSDISALHGAFSETTDALNQQKVTQVQTAEYFRAKDHPAPILIRWEKEDELLFRIESGAVQEVTQLLDQLFAYYQGIPDCTLADVKQHCQELTLECQKLLNYYLNQDTDSGRASANIQSIVNTLFSLEDLRQYYLQFFLNITNMLASSSVYRGSELIDQIQLYMQRNYQKDLTQEFVASLFYLNRSYLSQLFHKKTGRKFVDYLNMIRIEKAKELLADPNKKMYTIARAVGYDNTKYFFRIFKRCTGLTPDGWRRQQYGIVE